jgi:murein L,D-transpeptidase YafK
MRCTKECQSRFKQSSDNSTPNYSLSRLPVPLLFICLIMCRGNSLASAEEQKADQIIIVKSQHTLTLLSHGKPIKVYKVALDTDLSGPKEHQGDHKTPKANT